MPGTYDCEYIAVAGDNDSIQMRVDEIDAGSCTPVPEQPRLHVLERQRLAQQRIVEQIDLACRHVVGRAPPGMDTFQLDGGQGSSMGGTCGGHRGSLVNCSTQSRKRGV
jgi:hypothetical protein